MELLQLAEFETAARTGVPPDVWDYLQGGSGTESTLGANVAAFKRIVVRPRVLVDISARDLGTTLLGTPLDFPVAIAPMAFQRLAHPDGEVAAAAAAREAGTLFIASTFASRTFEEIGTAAGRWWLQVYWLRQRDALRGLLQRATQAGCQALMLTVDAPRLGRRLRDIRNGFTLPPGVSAVNVGSSVMAEAHERDPGSSSLQRHASSEFDPTITWADLAWLRAQAPLPLMLKGIVTAEDTVLAIDHGIDAIVVSNHGGRQLDGAIASLDALPEVVAAAAGRIPVLVDGGVRSGTDVFKALALGAHAVLVGRPVVWGLAHAGQAGVSAVLKLLRDELSEVMALAGRPRIADIDATAVGAAPG
ncbi:MAG TPA: alpha-hydroxy acid oxidase [Streptosporangiaceae bacterium]|nr:alpha-hydroxy acid oxidase [Streptosporangiaceae bacterium]